MLKIAICDDEKRQLENLSDFINLLIMDKKINAEIIFTTGSYDEMENFINTSRADLYIMDIDLKQNDMTKNGYTLAEKIRAKSKTDLIIFITGLIGYVQKGYDVNAFHFIPKPFDFNVLECVLIKAYELFYSIRKSQDIYNNDNDNDVINVMFGGILYRFKLEDIIFVEKIDLTKVKIRLNSGKVIESTLTIAEIENMAFKNSIIKTHKSFLCNVGYINSINYKKKEIIMKTGDICLLGRTFVDKVKHMFDRKGG